MSLIHDTISKNDCAAMNVLSNWERQGLIQNDTPDEKSFLLYTAGVVPKFASYSVSDMNANASFHRSSSQMPHYLGTLLCCFRNWGDVGLFYGHSFQLVTRVGGNNIRMLAC